jgi:DNA-binding MarR family transcriptional regulator
MVPVVAGLMAKGLLERTAADGRSHSLYLTKEGGEVHGKITKLALEHEQFFFGDVSDSTRQLLMQAFRALRAKGELWG